MTMLRWGAAAMALVLAAVCFLVVEPVSDAVVAAAGCAVLVAVTVTDLERRIIPNRVVLPALVAALAARMALDPSPQWVLGALVTGGILFVLALIHPAGLGMGDVKLAAFLGAWLGWEGLLAVVIGSFAAFLPALGVIVVKGRAARKIGLPLAPFLAVGGIVAVLAGHDIVDWWRSAGGSS
jgi:leader peptidase (prepilin peptidase) / N-methyltransferase